MMQANQEFKIYFNRLVLDMVDMIKFSYYKECISHGHMIKLTRCKNHICFPKNILVCVFLQSAYIEE